MTIYISPRFVRFICGLVALVMLGLGVSPSLAQTGSSQYFPPTGHTVRGAFLQYWQQHGGLAQQGYPLTEEFREKSTLNGQTYTVQYFERAVFEYHPENQPPYDVLLSQLGTQTLNTRYNGAACTVGGGNPFSTPPPAATATPPPQGGGGGKQCNAFTEWSSAPETGTGATTHGKVLTLGGGTDTRQLAHVWYKDPTTGEATKEVLILVPYGVSKQDFEGVNGYFGEVTDYYRNTCGDNNLLKEAVHLIQQYLHEAHATGEVYTFDQWRNHQPPLISDAFHITPAQYDALVDPTR